VPDLALRYKADKNLKNRPRANVQVTESR